MKQMSESKFVILALTLAGGLQDAYSYFVRDHVFANAQTGNIVLLGYYLVSGSFSNAMRYLFPILSFIIGVFIAELIHSLLKNNHLLHWRQIVLSLEVVLLVATAFMSTELNILANSLLSFVCAMQVSAFKKAHENSLATTMCIGNLRSGTEYFCQFLVHHDKKMLHKSGFYFLIIIFFFIGAIIGGLLSEHLGIYTILISAGVILICDIALFIKPQTSPEIKE